MSGCISEPITDTKFHTFQTVIKSARLAADWIAAPDPSREDALTANKITATPELIKK